MEKPQFNPFDPHGEVQVYRRHLPHWRQQGATYFVTFRLADSIPATILLQWQEQRRLWLAAHGIHDSQPEDARQEKYLAIPARERRRAERDEARRMHIELDRCHGSCLMRMEQNAEILQWTVLHFHGERGWIGDFTIMPNHVHLLVQPFAAHPLEKWLQTVKSYAARRFDKQVRKHDRVFQQESYDRIVRNQEELSAYRRYIENNGAKAGLQPGEYRHHRCDWL